MFYTKILLTVSIILLSFVLFFSVFKKRYTENGRVEEVEVVLEEGVEKEGPVDRLSSGIKEEDNVYRLFKFDNSKLPIVETIIYSMRVPWLPDRPAWISDYASYYETTKHFIARSLNGNLDYFTQKVSPGDRFNVLKKEISFYLVIDLTNLRLQLHGVDLQANKRYLLKTYAIGVGRKDSRNGCLTPKGKYMIGDRVAIYKPGIMGYFQNNQIEMIRVFGTRWIPFVNCGDGTSEEIKGLGLHGAPWIVDEKSQQLVEDRGKIGLYDSDGCVRLYSEDIEELFSIIITKPTYVFLVNDLSEVVLPGEET